jgi:hypothetical protein
MKQRFYANNRAVNFAGYCSPWVPVCPANEHLLQQGDLVIGADSIQRMHGQTRLAQQIEKGQIISAQEYNEPPVMVWLDLQTRDIKPFLANNPFADEYEKYSALVASALQQAAGFGIEPSSPLESFIYYQTTRESAELMLENGLTSINPRMIYGEASVPLFQCARSEGTIWGRSGQAGAMVKISIKDKANIRFVNWYDLNILPSFIQLALFLIQLSRSANIADRRYHWNTFAFEVGASAFNNQIMYLDIYDDLDIYQVEDYYHDRMPALKARTPDPKVENKSNLIPFVPGRSKPAKPKKWL